MKIVGLYRKKGDSKAKSVFQTNAIELCKQPKQRNRKRTPKISNKLY